MNKHYLVFAVTVLVILVLDQVTKIYVDSRMNLHDSIPVIQGFFNITYVRNPGAAFGIFATSSPLFRAVFLISVTVGALLLILYYVTTVKEREPLLHLGLSLIFGGAAGNLIDRVRFGEVIDFLDFYIGSQHWPAYNVADSAISVGAVLLLVSLIRKREEPSA